MCERPVLPHSCPSLLVCVGQELAEVARTQKNQHLALPVQ
jgi:hypothetical protein